MISRYWKNKAELLFHQLTSNPFTDLPDPAKLKLKRVVRFYRKRPWKKRYERDKHTCTRRDVRRLRDTVRKYGPHDIVRTKREWRIVWPNRSYPEISDMFTVDRLSEARAYIEAAKFVHARRLMVQDTKAALV